MLWPSAISSSMAGTPSAVAGILTSRFGVSIRSCSDLASVDGPGGVVGERRGDLERDEPVAAVAGVVDGSQERRGPSTMSVMTSSQ